MFVSIGADTSEFQKGMQGLSKDLQRTGKQISSVGKGMTKWVTGPIAGAAAALGGLALKTANFADSVLDASDATGMSTDAIQEWQHVARQAGVSTDAMTDAAGRLNRQWSSIENGSGSASAAIEDLNLDVEKLSDLDADDRLMELTKALGDIEDPSERARIGSDLFGRRWEEIAPIVAKGSDELEQMKESFDGVMTEEDLERADEFRQSWESLKEEIAILGRDLASDFIPLLQEQLMPLIEETIIPMLRDFGERIGRLIEWFSELDPQMQKIIAGATALLAGLGPTLVIIGKVITVVGKVTAAFAALNPIVLGIIATIALLLAAFKLLWENNEEFRERVMQIWDSIKDFFSEAFTFIKDLALSVFAKVKDFAKSAFESISEIISLALELIMELWDRFGEHIIKAWKWLWDLTSDILTNAWDTLTDIIDGALDVIQGVLDTFIGLVTGDWERMWDGMGDVVKGAANIIIGLVNGIIGAIESMVNAVGRGVNAIPKFEVPDWVPGIGGSTFGLPNIPELNLPSIPKLHTGGQYNAPNPGGEGLALLEDKEVVLTPGQLDAMQSQGSNVSYDGMMRGMFEGANISMKSDNDIKKLAREIKMLTDRKSRGTGVVT